MTALNDTGFEIVGVAPEASLYAYRVFGCTSGAASDLILAAMSKAFSDGVHIISMSIGGGASSWLSTDSYFSSISNLKNAGVAVVAASGNYGSYGLFTYSFPGGSDEAITVGSVSNSRFPLVWKAVDSLNETIPYGSVWPVNEDEGGRGKKVYIVSPPCDASAWATAFGTVDLNTTILAFESGPFCAIANAEKYWSTHPEYVMTFTPPSTNPFSVEYDVPPPGYYGSTSILNVNATFYALVNSSYTSVDGYPNYVLRFPKNKAFESPAQATAGRISNFSAWGPKWLSYAFKPQISAPGGHILSTWPLSSNINSGYAIDSGTSMATPFLAASYALLKSQFPTYSVDQIRELLQTTCSPRKWIGAGEDEAGGMLSSTAQQGAGLVDVWKAVMAQTGISPGQIVVGDNSRTEYGEANITITNRSPLAKTYRLAHVGAGYADYNLLGGEAQQVRGNLLYLSNPTIS